VGSTANFEFHVNILKNKAAKKRLAAIGWDITKDNSTDDKDIHTNINNALQSIYDVQNRIVQKKTETFKDKYLKTVDEALNNEGKDSLGFMTGFYKFDKMTLGFKGPDLNIIAAGPGEGKSTFALNIAKNISLNYGDVLYFSLEMSEQQLIWKLLSDEMNKSINDIRLGKFESNEALSSRLTNARLHIYDKGGLTIDDLVGIVKMEHKAKEIKIVIIDYIQLVRLGLYYRKVSNKNDEVTIISNKLKQLCLELNLPIVMLSQLNRDKHRKAYSLADLRDSGALEQDADNVFFIFRPEIHKMGVYELGTNEIQVNEQTTIINIAKQRLGVTGEFEMVFNGMCSRFEDTDENKANNGGYNVVINRSDLNDDLPF
jgi:replicative DNA helicase